MHTFSCKTGFNLLENQVVREYKIRQQLKIIFDTKAEYDYRYKHYILCITFELYDSNYKYFHEKLGCL